MLILSSYRHLSVPMLDQISIFSAVDEKLSRIFEKSGRMEIVPKIKKPNLVFIFQKGKTCLRSIRLPPISIQILEQISKQ